MQNVLTYLKSLKANNDRDWFHANKPQYDKAKKEFEALVNRLIPEINKFDPNIGTITAKDCVFRIFRDIRFSPDKTPYKTHFGAYIAKGGRKSMYAGYYLHIDAEESFAAGGLHMPPAENLKKVRQEIMYNIEEFKKIILSDQFKSTFGTFMDDKLTRPPKDFPADFADIELLKYKGFTVVNNLSEKDLLGDKGMDKILSAFKTLKPLNDFLNRGLE
ncbi:MAG TPA: DUF2461 domain-containing protein [Bacteroidales bacterium]|nr:DUF2461 domain-containing protein [Bacteroidales bacterium]HRX96776.1 DUF2461 domain-containing protein [Bacteroidales bacterium]